MESSLQVCEGAVSNPLLKIEVNPGENLKRKYIFFNMGEIEIGFGLQRSDQFIDNNDVLTITLS